MGEENFGEFKFIRREHIDGLNADIELFIHEKHKCPLINVSCPDENNFFAVTFRTTCADDTGSTHVLEHMTLHGSKRFPITEIFNELRKCSVASFLNAFTSPDWTMYPFSSTNKKDFMNILDVYMDAVFNPNLDLINFLSESHRLEFETPDDPSTPLRHTGVVYSEMSGQLSNLKDIYQVKRAASLFPDTPYKFVFGGDPDGIARLTLDELVSLHDKYYSPSNCVMFHYGSLPLGEITSAINEVINPIPVKESEFSLEPLLQKKWDTPKHVEVDGPLESMNSNPEKQLKASCSWIIGDATDTDTVSDLVAIERLIMGSSASPLYKSIIKEGLGTQWCDNGVNNEYMTVSFGIGIEGTTEETAVSFKDTLMKELNKIVENGFTETEIKSVIHQMELEARDIKRDQGINIVLSIIQGWIAGNDPFVLMNSEENIGRMKKRISSKPKYFESRIRELLIENQSRLDMIMRPVQGYMDAINNKRKEELERIKASLTDEEKQMIVKQSKEVMENIDAPKPLHLLPHITLSDLSKTFTPVEYKKSGDVFMFEQPTNGIAYVELKAELPLDTQMLPYIPLLNEVIDDIGGGGLDEGEFSLETDLHTGGISCFNDVMSDYSDCSKVHGLSRIKTSCVNEDIDDMFRLLRIVLFEPNLDNKEQIRAILEMRSSELSDELEESGNAYARMLASSSLSRSSALAELWFGITYIAKLKSLLGDIDGAIHLIKEIYTDVFRRAKFVGSVCGSSEQITLIAPKLQALLDELNGSVIETTTYGILDSFMNDTTRSKKIFIEYGTSVNFCAMVTRIPPYTENIKYSVLANLLEGEFLHPLIREKLGAYGAYAVATGVRGLVSLISYRDTHSKKVLKAFKQGINEIAEGHIDEAMLEKAKIQVISSMDFPQAPSKKGSSVFLEGIPDSVRQKRRADLFAVSLGDVVSAAKELRDNTDWRYTVFGSETVSKVPQGFDIVRLNLNPQN